MVNTPSISLDLLRKRSEHNEGELDTLEEIALHQFNFESISPLLQHACPRLKILLLQSNQICRIENLHKLKWLEYLNLALNNIQHIENLSRCESLRKLDLTCNFIKSLSGLYSLQNNYNLRELYLVGNDCAFGDNYRTVVSAILPQLEVLDGREFTAAERSQAKGLAVYQLPPRNILVDIILPSDVENREIKDDELTENTVKSRIQAARASSAKDTPERSINSAGMERSLSSVSDVTPKFHAKTGKIMQRNHLDVNYTFFDRDPAVLLLEVEFSRALDSSLIECDIGPEWISVVVKRKALHLQLPCEIVPSMCEYVRSLATGFLHVKMRRADATISTDPTKTTQSFTGYQIGAALKSHDSETSPNDAFPEVKVKEVPVVKVVKRYEHDGDLDIPEGLPPLL